MTESILIPVLTFVIGFMIGLLYKYSDIVGLKKDVVQLKETINVLTIVELASNVKAMKDSVIFTPGFQSSLSVICSEHGNMREKIETNSGRLTTIEANLGSGIRVNFGQKEQG